MSVTISDLGTGSPISIILALKRSRSSASLIVSSGVPSNSTAYLSITPASASSTARFSPVWPPSVGRSASGRSRSMIRSTDATVSGSR